jgi:hypothetical protein
LQHGPLLTTVDLYVDRILSTVAEYPIENEAILSGSVLSVKKRSTAMEDQDDE